MENARRRFRAGLALGLLAAVGLPARAQEPSAREAARAVLQRHAESLVTVRLVLKRRFIAQGRERGSADTPLEVAGTLLTPQGLTVVSDAATNPSVLSASPADAENRVDVDTSDVKIVLRDGRELPARVVLRDQDLDLAFVLPREAGLKLPALDLLAQAAPVPAPLDDLVFLYPTARSLNREVGVALERVRAVTKKPRTFVASDTFLGMQSLGCPVFDAHGRVVGLSVVRRAPRTQAGSGGLRDFFELLTPVVLTSADVSDVARQALQQSERPDAPPASPAPPPAP